MNPLRCPFCGSWPQQGSYARPVTDNNPEWTHYVECGDKRCSYNPLDECPHPRTVGKTPEDAMRKWNIRYATTT